MTAVLTPPTQPVPESPGPPRPPSRRTRRVVLWISALVAIVSIAFGAVSLADLLAHSRREQTLSFPVTKVLEVRTDGSVTVRAAAVEHITVVRRIDRGFRHPAYTAGVVGDRLVLTGSCPVMVNQWCRVSYTVEVPATTTVTVHADAGGVTVTGIDGDLDLSSSAGSVTVTDASGAVRAHSSAGSVTADHLRAADVDASSSAGRVSLSFAVPPSSVVAHSSAGSVEVVVPDDETAYRVDASSSAGSESVDVRTDPASTRTIEVSSSAGSVRIHYPT
jgi:hypothetical protein